MEEILKKIEEKIRSNILGDFSILIILLTCSYLYSGTMLGEIIFHVSIFLFGVICCTEFIKNDIFKDLRKLKEKEKENDWKWNMYLKYSKISKL